MAKHLHKYPALIALFLIATPIITSYYFRVPFNLTKDTDVTYLDSTAIFRIVLTEQPIIHGSNLRAQAHITQVHLPNSTHIRCNNYAEFYLQTDSTSSSHIPSVGDVLLVRGRMHIPTPIFPDDFDYGKYLRLQHKVGTCYAKSDHWQIIGHTPPHTLRTYAASLRARMVARYAATGLSGRTLAVVAAITLGERNELQSDLRQSFAAAGAAHVLAVSGLHTGFIYAIIMALLTCFGLRRPLYEQRAARFAISLIAIIALWAYAILTGLSPSVERAAIMLSLAQLAWACRRTPISINTLAVAACICLCIDPLSLFSISFQLSFTAVLAIILFMPVLNGLLPTPHKKITRYIRDIITISIAASIGTLPISLFYFAQMSNHFLLTNLIIIPLASILVPLSLLTLAVGPCLIGKALAFCVYILTEGMCRYIEWIEHLPFAITHLSITLPMLICLFAALLFAWLMLSKGRFVWLSGVVATLTIFCILNVHHVQQIAHSQQLSFRGQYLYYKHNDITDKQRIDDTIFFRWNGQDYAYTNTASPLRKNMLRQYCTQHDILIWEN